MASLTCDCNACQDDAGPAHPLSFAADLAAQCSCLHCSHHRLWSLGTDLAWSDAGDVVRLQTWTFPVDMPVTEDPYVEVDCLPGPPTFQRTDIEEIYQNERRLTQFSRFSTKQMFPTDRAPWADPKNRPQYKEGVRLPVSHILISFTVSAQPIACAWRLLPHG